METHLGIEYKRLNDILLRSLRNACDSKATLLLYNVSKVCGTYWQEYVGTVWQYFCENIQDRTMMSDGDAARIIQIFKVAADNISFGDNKRNILKLSLEMLSEQDWFNFSEGIRMAVLEYRFLKFK